MSNFSPNAVQQLECNENWPEEADTLFRKIYGTRYDPTLREETDDATVLQITTSATQYYMGRSSNWEDVERQLLSPFKEYRDRDGATVFEVLEAFTTPIESGTMKIASRGAVSISSTFRGNQSLGNISYPRPPAPFLLISNTYVSDNLGYKRYLMESEGRFQIEEAISAQRGWECQARWGWILGYQAESWTIYAVSPHFTSIYMLAYGDLRSQESVVQLQAVLTHIRHWACETWQVRS